MRIMLTSFFIIFSFFSCSSDKVKSVQDLQVRISPEIQEFGIDPSKDNIIKGKKGIKIFIPANVLRFKDGTIPSGKVRIGFREYVSVSDFISSNLSTVSDNVLLETGGMLYFSATSDGKELVIDNDQSYTIAFPNRDSTRNMETFYGDTLPSGTVNWTPRFGVGQEGDALGGLDSTLLDSTMFELKTRVCSYLGGVSDEGAPLRWLGWNLKHSDSTIFLYIERNFPTTDTAAINALCIKGLTPYMELTINSDGKIIQVEFDRSGDEMKSKSSAFIRNYISNFLKSMPPFDMNSMKLNSKTKYSLRLCCHQSLNWEEYNRRFREKYSDYYDKMVKEMGTEALNYYIISSSRLGWINCDRFYEDQREKINFIVKAPPGDTKTFIVFQDINSIMAGKLENGNFVFPNVPLDAKVRVIAINVENGKPAMAIQQNTVSKNVISLSGFKSFTLSELEKQLNKG